jgi:poly(hydroxyalkanoate) depolymerase family esterase
LLVVLHGFTQSAETIALQTGWDQLAAENNFHVLYPQQKIVNNPNICFNWFNSNDISKEQGEASSIKNMILYLSDSLNIDKEKIYVYGVSAGAAMAVSLMALYPELFKAGASIAGAPYGSANDFIEAFKIMIDGVEKTPEAWAKHVNDEHPNQKVTYPKLIVLHGTKDMIVNMNNSYELIKQWCALNHTDTIADEIKNKFEGNSNVQKIKYFNANKKAVVTFYKINHLGHALAVDPGTLAKQGGETGLFATDMDFFSTWYIAQDFGLVR